MSVQRLSHIGICVSDLERSVRFYRDVLEFSERSRFNVQGEASARLTDIPGGKIETVYLERGDTRLELLYYPDAGHTAGETPRPMNQLGLTHLSMRVQDLNELIARIEEAGGSSMEHTRVENNDWGSKAIFVTDPDGLRIELLELPGDPNSLPGD